MMTVRGAVASLVVSCVVVRGGGADEALCTAGRTWANCSYAVATMGTQAALLELELFLRTLRRFDAARAVYAASRRSWR